MPDDNDGSWIRIMIAIVLRLPARKNEKMD